MKLHGILLPALLAVTATQAADITVKADPALPVPNLVVNPGMERGENGKPEGWRFGTAIPDNFLTAWRDSGRGGKCLWLEAKSGKMSGYWHTGVRVTAGKKYLCTGRYRLEGGRILCYVHANKRLADGRVAVVNERFYAGSLCQHWLVPVFLPPECLGGPDPKKWYSFRLTVTPASGVDVVSLSLGMYFTPGSAWFDDVWFGLAETTLLVTVQCAQGERVQRVLVTRTGADKAVFDSKGISPPRASFECTLPKQPTTEVFTVKALLADGRSITRTYPNPAERRAQ